MCVNARPQSVMISNDVAGVSVLDGSACRILSVPVLQEMTVMV